MQMQIIDTDTLGRTTKHITLHESRVGCYFDGVLQLNIQNESKYFYSYHQNIMTHTPSIGLLEYFNFEITNQNL